MFPLSDVSVKCFEVVLAHFAAAKEASGDKARMAQSIFNGFFTLFGLRGINKVDPESGLRTTFSLCSEADFMQYWMGRVPGFAQGCFCSYADHVGRGDQLILMRDVKKGEVNMSVVAVPSIIANKFTGLPALMKCIETYSHCPNTELTGTNRAKILRAAKEKLIDAYDQWEGLEPDRLASYSVNSGDSETDSGRYLVRCHAILSQLHYKARPEALATLAVVDVDNAARLVAAQNGDVYRKKGGSNYGSAAPYFYVWLWFALVR
jgi:hypothetical protein